jgi:hypothetical protein
MDQIERENQPDSLESDNILTVTGRRVSIFKNTLNYNKGAAFARRK